jgi:hypothetical protein
MSRSLRVSASRSRRGNLTSISWGMIWSDEL